MEDWLKILIGALGTIIVAGGSVVVAYLNKLRRQLEEKTNEDERKHKKLERYENQINSLNNGFRETVYQRLSSLETDVKLIKEIITAKEKKKNEPIS